MAIPCAKMFLLQNLTTKKMKMPKIPKKYLGAFKQGHRQSAKEFIDDEFAYQLLDRIIANHLDLAAIQMLEYLTRFNNEYYKAVIKHDDPASLHQGEVLVKECFRLNNSRNRDVMSTKHCERVDIYLEITKKI